MVNMGNQFASHFTDFKMECFLQKLKSFEEKSKKLTLHHKIMKSNKLYITLLKREVEVHEVRKHEDWSSLNPS